MPAFIIDLLTEKNSDNFNLVGFWPSVLRVLGRISNGTIGAANAPHLISVTALQALLFITSFIFRFGTVFIVKMATFDNFETLLADDYCLT